jgi:hypothetical protein
MTCELAGSARVAIKVGIESGAIPTVQLGPRRMIPRVSLLRLFGINHT